MLTQILLIAGVILIMASMMVLWSYAKLIRRRKAAKGQVLCIFRSVAGDYAFEFCPYKGPYVYRYGEVKGKQPKETQLGKEVYTLRQSEPSYFVSSERVQERDEETGKTKIVNRQIVMTASQVKERVGSNGDARLERRTVSRGHVLYPIMGGSFFDPQINVPVAEFIEGFAPEVSTISVALEEFRNDPNVSSNMMGNVVDEKLTKLAAWFSSYIDELRQELSKMINPQILYILLAIMAIMVLVCCGLVWSTRSQLAEVLALVKSGSGTP